MTVLQSADSPSIDTDGMKPDESSPMKKSEPVSKTNDVHGYHAGDRVVVKIQGYPWWPAVVCQFVVKSFY